MWYLFDYAIIYKITEDFQYLWAKVGMTTCIGYIYDGRHIELFLVKWFNFG